MELSMPIFCNVILWIIALTISFFFSSYFGVESREYEVSCGQLRSNFGPELVGVFWRCDFFTGTIKIVVRGPRKGPVRYELYKVRE